MFNASQWRIQNFPGGGCAKWYFLPKTAWKWKNLDPGASLAPPQTCQCFIADFLYGLKTEMIQFNRCHICTGLGWIKLGDIFIYIWSKDTYPAEEINMFKA